MTLSSWNTEVWWNFSLSSSCFISISLKLRKFACKSWSNTWSNDNGFSQSSTSSSSVLGFKPSKNSSLKWSNGEKDSNMETGGETDNDEPNNNGLCDGAKSISILHTTDDSPGIGVGKIFKRKTIKQSLAFSEETEQESFRSYTCVRIIITW